MNVCWPVPVVIVLSTVAVGGGVVQGGGPSRGRRSYRALLSVMAAASRASSLSL